MATIPRSREVGQSYITSIWTTLVAMSAAVWIVVKAAPDLVCLCQPLMPSSCPPAHCLWWAVDLKGHSSGAREWARNLHTDLPCCSNFQVYASLTSCISDGIQSDQMGLSEQAVPSLARTDHLCGEYCSRHITLIIGKIAISPEIGRPFLCAMARIATRMQESSLLWQVIMMFTA